MTLDGGITVDNIRTNGSSYSNFTQLNVGGGFGATGTTLNSNGQIKSDGPVLVENTISASKQLTVGTYSDTDGHITASGNISASGTQHIFGANVGIGTTVPTKPLTVEGDISASGDLYVDDDLTVGGSANGRINIGNIGVLNGETNSAFDISSVGAIHYDADSNDNSGGSLDNHIFKIGGSEKMRISGSGNIGIGTTTPTETLQVTGNISASGEVNINATDALFSSKLTVNGDAYCANGGWKLGSAATFIGEITSDSGILTIQSDGQRDIQFNNTSTSASVFIEGQNGNVGIGTTSPTQKLEVHGVTLISGSAPALEFSDIGDNGSEAMIRIDSPDMEIFSGRTGGLHNNIEIRTGDNDNSSTVRMFISGSSGNVGIGTATPSKTLTVVGDISASGDLYVSQSIFLNDGTSYADSTIESISDTLQIKDKGSIKIAIDSDGGGSSGHKIQFGTGSIAGGSAFQPLMTISSSGNVGIGTIKPAGRLQVTSDGSNKFFGVFSASTAAGAYKFYQDSNNHMQLYGYNSSGTANVVINTNGVSYLKGGNVLIGGSSNNAVDKLQVAGSTFISSHITASGNISASSNLIVNGITASSDVYSDDVYVASEIIHTDDPNTKIAFDPDKVTFTIGGLDMITLTEDSTDTIALGAAISTPITASGDISSS